MKEPKTKLGSFIRAARKERGLSQRELAKRARVAFTTIQRIETEESKPSANNVAAIIRALDIEEELDADIKEMGLSLDEAEKIIAIIEEIDSRDSEEYHKKNDWYRQEIMMLVKKINHAPLLETLLDVTHAVYTEQQYAYGVLQPTKPKPEGGQHDEEEDRTRP